MKKTQVSNEFTVGSVKGTNIDEKKDKKLNVDPSIPPAPELNASSETCDTSEILKHGESVIDKSAFKDTSDIIIGVSHIIGGNFTFCSNKLKKELQKADQKTIRKQFNKTYKNLQIQLDKISKSNSDLKLVDGENKTPITVIKTDLNQNIKKIIYKMPAIFQQLEEKILRCTEEIKNPTVKEDIKREATKRLAGASFLKRELKESLENEKNLVFMKNKGCLKVNWFGDFENHLVFLSEDYKNKDLRRFVGKLKCSESGNSILGLNKALYDLPWANYMSENVIRFFVVQILGVLDYFKLIRLVHGNFTLENIILTNDFRVKITDFACSRFFGGDILSLNKFLHEVDPANLPSHYFTNGSFIQAKYANKIDIFSLGCAIFTMASNQNLFDSNDQNRETKIQNLSDILFKFTGVKRSPEFVHLLQRMLETSDRGRISVDELKGLPWVQNNLINIRDLDETFCDQSEKKVAELMKSDYVQYYNRSPPEEDYYKVDVKTCTRLEYSHFQVKSTLSDTIKKSKTKKIIKKNKIFRCNKGG